MDFLKVATFNVKDNALKKKDNYVSSATNLAELIKREQIDILGTQELTISYVNKLKLSLGNYKFCGNYRYGDGLLLHMPYNENNNIISNQSILSSFTTKLPWIPNNLKDLKTSIVKCSIMPRIVTIAIIKTEGGRYITFINTHLDYQIPSVQYRQLEEIKKLISKYRQKYNCPVILTGDFNMDNSDSLFCEFVETLQYFDMDKVKIEQPTFYYSSGFGKELDHIFLSKEFSINDAGIIESGELSDHELVYAKVKIR